MMTTLETSIGIGSGAGHLAAPALIEELLASPTVSHWAKDALRLALLRDPVDAAQDAAMLADVLNLHAEHVLKQASQLPVPGRDGL